VIERTEPVRDRRARLLFVHKPKAADSRARKNLARRWLYSGRRMDI